MAVEAVRERRAEQNVFQRDSILALQDAFRDLFVAADREVDRMFACHRQTGEWPRRTFSTPTEPGWIDAVLRLEQSKARVFDDEVRSLATEMRQIAYDAEWAADAESCEENYKRLLPLRVAFQEAVTRVLPTLY